MPANTLNDVETFAVELAAARRDCTVADILNFAVRDFLARYNYSKTEIIDTLAPRSENDLKENISQVLRTWQPNDDEDLLSPDWSIEWELGRPYGQLQAGNLIGGLTDAIFDAVTDRTDKDGTP